MPKKASTHGPSKSKTARSKTTKAKSKDKAVPRKEARKVASEAGSKPIAAAAKQGGSPRRSRSRSLSPDIRPNPRFAYRDHSPGAESPDALVHDAEPSEAKAASVSSPATNLTLDDGKTRAQAAKAAFPKRAGEGAAAAKKRAAPQTPPRESGFSKDYHSLFESSSDDAEEEGAITEPQEISNYLDEQHERYQAAQLQGASEVASSAPPTPVYPRGYYPPDAGSGSPMFLERLKDPRDLKHGSTSRGTYERASVQDEPLFVNDIEAARCPENTTTQSQAEDLFWRWVPLKNFTVQELKELREDRLLSYVLDQRDLRIEFAHLIANQQLHSVMEGLRQQSMSSAQAKRGYGSVNPGTVHRKAAKKPRTTYAPAVDPKFQQPSGWSSGSHKFCDEGGARRSDQGGQEELSHAFEYEAFDDEVRQLRDRVYAIEIALGLGPGGQAAAQAGKPGTLEVLRQWTFLVVRLESSTGVLTAEVRLPP
ncbi:ABC Superfamily [Phytophthora palmivora]|uniref:ABC Superfamily n=1 Tax=Phytophthora palmivora TaxID=4796 RepID=A0A2P4XVR4_9STRA|nr:ABC Superfamily [Phytophthora palmivora]